jgi:TonB family protein
MLDVRLASRQTIEASINLFSASSYLSSSALEPGYSKKSFYQLEYTVGRSILELRGIEVKMGKIVKYCNACEEGFAEKFAFCPNCGAGLTAFELNPLAQETPKVETAPETKNFAAEPAAPVSAPETFYEPQKTVEPETAAFVSEEKQPAPDDEYLADETAAFTATAAASNGNGYQNNYQTKFSPNDAPPSNNASNYDDGYHITIVEEKHSAERNALLLGSWFLVTTLALGGVVYSLFDKELFAAEINTGEMLAAMIPVDDTMEIAEEEPEPKKDDKDAGGGGGGGRNEPDPVSKGRLAMQSPEKPIFTPSVTIPQMKTDMPMRVTTQGPLRPAKETEGPYGDPNSTSYKLSDGPGSGAGQGSGRGTGQGSGVGTGAGSGRGSGMGSGIGDGIGGGRGTGVDNDGDNEPPKPKDVGPPTPLKIISKPRPNYTDAARTNNVQGVVRLRVTFLANGSIGSISPVSGLGYGLTEAAIAAARSIRFEPAKKGGVPQTVTRVVEFNFALY